MLDQSGQVFVCGKGDKGQLGMGHFSKHSQNSNETNLYYPTLNQSFADAIIDVQAGRDFSLFLTQRQEVYASGANSLGQLGLGDSQECYMEPVKVPSLQDVKKIECNEGSVCLDNHGQMFIWGQVSKDKSLIIPTKV